MSAYHVTWCTYCSRPPRWAQRHFPYAAVRLLPEEEIIVAQSIASTIKAHGLDVFAFSVCEDHVHIALDCDAEHLPKIIHLLKGRSARGVRQAHKSRHDHVNHLWGKSYHAVGIFTDGYLDAVISYIHRNRRRHGLPYIEELEDLFL